MAVWSLYTELLEDAVSQEIPLSAPDTSALVADVARCRARLCRSALGGADVVERLEAEITYDLALIHLARAYGMEPDPATFANPDRVGRTSPECGRRRAEEFVATRALALQAA